MQYSKRHNIVATVNTSVSKAPNTVSMLSFEASQATGMTIEERVLYEKVHEDFRTLGIENENILKEINYGSILGYQELLPIRHIVKLQRGNTSLIASLNIEIDFQDGYTNAWTGRIFMYPISAISDGLPLEITSEMALVGYQILISKPGTFAKSLPLVRMDSLCSTSFYDQGHRASGGITEIGCDCFMQRQLAKAQIFDQGGISILSPFSGRGNGSGAQSSELHMRNFAVRHYVPFIPDTYQAHVMQGHPRDNRNQYYWIDGLILSELFGLKRCTLLTNNPEKIAALTKLGITVAARQHKDNANESYYSGIDGIAKRTDGNHAI